MGNEVFRSGPSLYSLSVTVVVSGRWQWLVKKQTERPDLSRLSITQWSDSAGISVSQWSSYQTERPDASCLSSFLSGWTYLAFLFPSGHMHPVFLFLSGQTRPAFLFLSGQMHPTNQITAILLLSNQQEASDHWEIQGHDASNHWEIDWLDASDHWEISTEL